MNPAACEDSSVKSLCHIADSWEEMIIKLQLLMNEPFTEKMISERQVLLAEQFDNRKNAKRLIELLF
jgi:hypothetical protein